jgi:Cu/Ag efflux pump CusA
LVAILSEEKEEKRESWFEMLSFLKKFHPVAFLGMFFLMYFFTKMLNSGSVPLTQKIPFLLISGTLYVLVFCFECYRIDQQEKQQEKLWG